MAELTLQQKQALALAAARARAAQQAAQPPAGAVPGSRAYADWAAQQARAGKTLPQVSPKPPEWQGTGIGTGPMDQFQAGYTSAVNAIPIAGPSLLNAVEGAKAGMYGVPKETITGQDRGLEQANPGAATTGSIVGTVAPWVLAGASPLAPLLGMGEITGLGSFAANSALSAGSSGIVGGLDSLARGRSPEEALRDAAISAGLGAVVPGAGAALHGGAKLLGKGADWMTGGALSTFGRMRNPAAAGQEIVGKAVGSDVANGSALSPALEQFAQQTGQPIANLDRGGSVTRNLARTASNVSPDAEAMLKGATDRAVSSGSRVSDYLTNIVGGSANDVAFRKGLEDSARLANAPAYKAAYSAPSAQSIWTPEIQQLTFAPEMQAAIRKVEGTGKTWAALNGGKAALNPFVIAADGSIKMRPGVTPSLQFWDQVQRNLRELADAAPPGGEKASRIGQLRSALNGALDNAVPEFKQARAGAAMFFGAENALDAGRQFGSRLGQVPEAEAAFAKFTAPEKKAFAIGWASSMVDKLGTRDGYGVVKQTFENPNARKMAQMALGPQKAAQLESFLKVESIMQFGNDAIKGNSTTAKQLAMMGTVGIGTGGYGVATGDWRPLTIATALTAGRAGMQYLGRSVDQKVMEEVARLLSSNDKAALNKVIANASLSPRWKQALNAVFLGMGYAAHAGTVAVPEMVAQ